ncbi:nuclear pore complex protein NUP50A-like [Andrographis paniculata]|uniref:nuclear pore complex protein NUP50A-like n=1 Tax=Andrographis paniculata TaxID=175694 RepID=UPI0021E83CAE|nr:nuclear pore complex protein NUP50A-like [Andrographis paniculata]
MGDAENSSQPSKKRVAGVQLTRDNPGLDDDEDSSEMIDGTFKKASDEILATRRIVKVRRQPAATPKIPASSSGSNPFASICLVPTASSAPPVVSEVVSIRSNENEKTDGAKPENQIDKPQGESAAQHEKSGGNDELAKESEIKIVDRKSEPEAAGNETNGDKDELKITTAADNSNTEFDKDTEDEENVKEKENVDGVETEAKKGIEGEESNKGKESAELPGGENLNDGVHQTTAADKIETECKKDVEPEGNNHEKENVEATDEKNNKGPVSFGLFQQLSNSQNAFSGFTGTGFSTTSFTFGAGTGFSNSTFSFGLANKDGHALESGTVPFFGLNSDLKAGGFGKSFGPSTNGTTSIFGKSAKNASTNEGSKIPPMQEVTVETGEENEKSVFTGDSVLYEYADGAWKERGKGEVKVNAATTGTGKARLIMRARGNYRLILNASLFPDMKLTNMDKKGVTFACMNSAAEGKEGLSTVALRFKDAFVVEEFKGVVNEYKSKMPPPAATTPENSPKAD